MILKLQEENWALRKARTVRDLHVCVELRKLKLIPLFLKKYSLI